VFGWGWIGGRRIDRSEDEERRRKRRKNEEEIAEEVCEVGVRGEEKVNGPFYTRKVAEVVMGTGIKAKNTTVQSESSGGRFRHGNHT